MLRMHCPEHNKMPLPFNTRLHVFGFLFAVAWIVMAIPTVLAQGIEPYKAREIEVYRAPETKSQPKAKTTPLYQAPQVQIQTTPTIRVRPERPTSSPPVKPAAPSLPGGAPTNSPAVKAPTKPMAPQASSQGNAVEPLSNGLKLSMTKGEIVKKFGEPQPGWDSRTLDYGAFSVMVGGQRKEIWHLTIKRPGLKLHSGLQVGSPQKDVEAVFGQSSGGRVGQYQLAIAYDAGALVRSIKIDPAEESFKAFDQAPANPKATPLDTAALVGVWHGHTSASGAFYTVGTLEMRADHTYTYNANGHGRYAVQGEQIVFVSGPLTAWDKGRATFTQDKAIEFKWKNEAGWNQWFVFIK